MLAFAVLAAVIAPAITFAFVWKKARRPELWAVAGLAAHLFVGNVANRWVLPALVPKPTGKKSLHLEPGEYMHGSLSEYRARVRWIRSLTNISMGCGLCAAALLGLAVRLSSGGRADGPSPDAPAAPPQLVGRRCAVCDERIVTAPQGVHCEGCGAPLHRECLTVHQCGPAAPPPS
ncbi:MAG: hypothetical protein ABI333_17190 [bacterium]